MRLFSRLGVFVIVSSVAATASAQPVCDRSESFETCLNALLTKTVSDIVTEDVVEKASPATNPGSTGALFDFLPGFVASLGIAGLSERDGNLNLDKSFELGAHWRLDLGGTAFSDAELFEPLRLSLDAMEQEELAGDLDEQIGDFDKVDFRALLTGEGTIGGRRFGRDPQDYRRLLDLWVEEWVASPEFDDDVDSAIQGGTPFARWRGSQEVGTAMTDYAAKVGGQRSRMLTDDVADVEKELGATRVADLEQGLSALAEQTIALTKKLGSGPDFDRIDELIANQPQILAEVGYREREDLTGPVEKTFNLSYEMGLSGNLNDFETWAENHSGLDACKPRTDAEIGVYYGYDCLEAYLTTDSALLIATEDGAAKSGHRLVFTFSYTDTDPLSFASPDGAFTYALARSEKVSGLLTYGRYFKSFQLPNLLALSPAGSDAEPSGNARIDVEARYDDVSGDPTRQSRLTATATISQKMSDNTVLSLSAVWAEKPEYLGEVDEEVSARFGLKWQRDKPKTSSAAP